MPRGTSPGDSGATILGRTDGWYQPPGDLKVGLHLAFRQPVHSALDLNTLAASCSSIHRKPRHVCVPSPVRVFVVPALPFII